MHKRGFWLLYVLALLLMLTLTFRSFRTSAQEVIPISAQIEEQSPQTGSWPWPFAAAMVLAFSGVGICLLADDINRRK